MIEKFLIKRLECRCRVCNSEFILDSSNDNQLVKIYLDDESSVKWIRMYGERGYLNLIEKLVKKGASDQINMTTVSLLESKLSDLLKKKITIDKGIRICPICNSKDISIIKENIFESNDLELCDVEI